MYKFFSNIFIFCAIFVLTSVSSQAEDQINNLEITSNEQNSQYVFNGAIDKYTEDIVEISIENIELNSNLIIDLNVKNLSLDKAIEIKTHNLEEAYITKFDIIENAFSISDNLETNIAIMSIIPKPNKCKAKSIKNIEIPTGDNISVILETFEFLINKNASFIRIDINPRVLGNENICSFKIPMSYISPEIL